MRRPVRVAGRAGCCFAGAARRVFAALAGAGAGPRELAVDDVVTFLEPAARAALAFSTMLDNIVVAEAADRTPPAFRGEPGRLRYDLVGDAGISRWVSRELDDVGDKTCVGRTELSCMAARTRFFIVSPSISFSLSPPEISVLHTLEGFNVERYDDTYLIRLLLRAVFGRELGF